MEKSRPNNPNSNSNDSRARRVYVGNLSWGTRWQELKDHMRTAGNVVRANILEDQDGRSKGCAIVTYETPEEAQAAIERLTDTELMNRRIFVREDREDTSELRARAPRYANDGGYREGGFGGGRMNGGGGGGGGGMSEGGHAILVENLPQNATWQSLKDKFREAGDVIRADVFDGSAGRCKGTVIFRNGSGVARAIEMFDNYEMDGCPIKVRANNRRTSRRPMDD